MQQSHAPQPRLSCQSHGASQRHLRDARKCHRADARRASEPAGKASLSSGPPINSFTDLLAFRNAAVARLESLQKDNLPGGDLQTVVAEAYRP